MIMKVNLCPLDNRNDKWTNFFILSCPNVFDTLSSLTIKVSRCVRTVISISGTERNSD